MLPDLFSIQDVNDFIESPSFIIHAATPPSEKFYMEHQSSFLFMFLVLNCVPTFGLSWNLVLLSVLDVSIFIPYIF